MSNTPLYNSLFPAKYKEDDFGWSPEWKLEIEKWLKCTKFAIESAHLTARGKICGWEKDTAN